MIFISHLQPLQISNKAKFHALFEKVSHLKLKPARLKINSLTFYKMNFHTRNVFKKVFFIWMGGKRFALARARMDTHPHSSEKKSLLETFLSWADAGLKFEAVVDVIWKSFLVRFIPSMLNFFQIKYFDVDTHGAFDSGSVYFISECQGHSFQSQGKYFRETGT